MTSASTVASSTDVRARIQFRNILLPTDFSEASREAARLAGMIAARCGANLCVAHALWNYDGYWCDTNFQLESDEELSRKDMAQFLAETSLAGLKPTEIYDRGSAAELTHRICRKQNIDLIILGTSGIQGALKLLFGSNSERILRSVPCPVLTVGPKVTPEHCTGEFKRILFAVDFEPELIGTYRWAAAIAEKHDARMTMINVVPETRSVHDADECEQAQMRMMLLMRECDITPPHPPEILVQTGSAVDEILRAAKDCNADLIVMGVHPSMSNSPRVHALGGHAYPVAVEAYCPVFTVCPG